MGVNGGFPIVLTADRTLMAGYRLLFDGILACSQTTASPGLVVRSLLLPRAGGAGPRAHLAPLGLRRIEAALIRDGFGPDEVAVVDEDHLPEAIGPKTQVVGVSTGDPAGLGMSTTTMQAIAGGRGYPPAMFGRMMEKLRRALAAAGYRARVLVGGPGAWQLAADSTARESLGIDHVVTGYADGNAAAVFRALMSADEQAATIVGEGAPADCIPRIIGASTMGVVELSRGCGLGCSFCTIASVPMQHLPDETILADVETDVAAGVRHIALASEDIFRYGGTGLRARPEALISLLARIREMPGVGLVQTDHGNVLSVSQYSDEELREVRRLMVGETGQQFPWVNIGVETASGTLLRAAGCGAKMGRIADDDWAGASAEQLRRLSRAGFLPMASLVIGLPGETEEDLMTTIEWVKSLGGERVTVFPLVLASLDARPGNDAVPLGPLHWRLIERCYRLNFRWIPRLYWDSQRAAGVSLARRCIAQLLGLGETLRLKAAFARRLWRCRNGH